MESSLFSQKLIDSARAYLSKKYGRDISVDEAIALLDSVADLYLVMKGAATARRRASGAADLIDPHSC